VTLLTRNRVIAVAMVGAFVAVFAGIGAVSRSSPTAAAPAVTTAGLPSAWYWTMVVSPDDPNVLVLGTSKGVYRSGDGGKTWQATGPKSLNATSLVQAGDSIFVGGVHLAPNASPNPIIRKGSGRTVPDGPAVLATSTDDGRSWQELHPRGLPKVAVQALAVDPASGTKLYALLNTGRLYRSTDGGESFQLVVSKLGVAPWALAITQGSRFVAGDMDSGSHVSTNGKAWQRSPFIDSKGGRMVMEYAVDPADSSRVLMSEFGIVISADGGKTWHSVLKSQAMFGPIAWAPSKTEVAYAVAVDGSLWRSDNGGRSWKKVS
jgi:photosystem II stability/assembly factor-like uncharacterized protein